MSGSLWGWWLLLSPLSAQAEFQRLARPSSDITQCPVQPRVRYQHCLHLVSSGSHAHGTGCQTVGRWLWYKFRALCFLCPLKLHTFPEAALPGTVSLKETWKLFSFLFEKKKKISFEPICSGKPSRFNGCFSTRPTSQVPRCSPNSAEISSVCPEAAGE